MSTITIPAKFASGVLAERGDSGSAWLEALPARIENYCTRWGLIIDGDPLHGYIGLVVPARRGEELCALKISWVDDETRHEALALRLWNGQGAVRLLEAEDSEGALLLERLDAKKCLASIEIEEAIKVAGRLLRRLAIPAPIEPLLKLPTQREYADRMLSWIGGRWEKLGRPFSRTSLMLAQEYLKKLKTTTASFLVNQDLHYENILAAKREPWLVIDPKVIVGDVEFGIFPLLLNRFDEYGTLDLSLRFQAIVGSAELDSQLSRLWTFVRCINYWLWAIDVGLTQDLSRCEKILGALR